MQFRSGLIILALMRLLCLRGVQADVYINHPRGSNNKMTEQNNNAQNQNRLFDSQNNAAGGYQIGDNCVPNCKETGGGNRRRNNYNASKQGSQEGQMYYYHNSELWIEWTVQHGCGTPASNTACQVVLQYMCASDAQKGHPDETPMRDGKDPDSPSRRRTAGGDQQNAQGANLEAADEPERGRHETFESYNNCRKRQRNKGLYTAGRNLNENIGAVATRQNNNNNRRGLECPEERDYYPYWHPAEWRDMAIFTSEPETRCKYYREESQNVKARGYCYSPKLALDEEQPATLNSEDQVPNNPTACAACANDGCVWREDPSWDIDPPECFALPQSRDNHHGNMESGHPMNFMWKIPETIQDNDTCIIRIRYNMTSGDFSKSPKSAEKFSEEWDYFTDLDSSYNEQGRQPISQNPKKDFIGLGGNRTGPLQVQVNTAQFGRTFEDRTHTFQVHKTPSFVSKDARIVNYNVRGRRGNIVQVYPSVEYDFVPPDLEVPQGTFLHFQWTGSDANNNGNAGNGRAGTDRSNLVQIKDRSGNKPMPISEHTLFFDFQEPEQSDQGPAACNAFTSSCGRSRSEGEALVEKFSFLNQNSYAEKVGAACPSPEELQDKDDNDEDNCLQLNAAPAYFDGGLVEMRSIGTHHIASTRNNDYSNRSHKATITVTKRMLQWVELVVAILAPMLAVFLAYHIISAVYAFMRPTSNAFSKKNRPCLLRMPCLKRAIATKEAERRLHKHTLHEAWKKHCDGQPLTKTMSLADADPEALVSVEDGSKRMPGEAADFVAPPEGFQHHACALPCFGACSMRLNRRFGACLHKSNLFAVAFVFLNIFVAMVGYIRHQGRGFNDWFAVAKCGGYILDFNLSVILIPTLRSVQTGARHIHALDVLLNEDPILFHIRVACCVVIGTLIHVTGHIMHDIAIVEAPVYSLAITPKQKLSGKSAAELIFDPSNRFAVFSGIIILYMMSAMFLTATSYVRRQTYDFNHLPRDFKGCLSWLLLFLVALLLLPLWLPLLLWKLVFHRESLKLGSKRLGGFTVFWQMHKCWKPVFALLLVHGPQCWIWFMWPLLLVLCDRLIRKERRNLHMVLKSAELLKGKVVKLTFVPPPGFIYQAGMYALLNCDAVNGEEWHPFTLTSAPEEPHLSMHIRCPDELDWCSALRRKLVEGPAADISKGAIDTQKSARLRVIYAPYVLETPYRTKEGEDDGYARPWRVEVLNESGVIDRSFEVSLKEKKESDQAKLWPTRKVADPSKTKTAEEADAELERQESAISVQSMHQLHPGRLGDVIRLGLDGPHGAPSEMVWQHRVVVLVGAGIGVTPFASILRSILMRKPATIELTGGGMGRGQPQFKVIARMKAAAQRQQPDGAEDSVQTSESYQWKPCERIHFYWLCRSQDEFEWFYGLLQEAVRAAQGDHLEVNLFQTGEAELSKVKDLGCGFRQFFGRPNWNRIFPKLAQDYPGESVGVFLCGPAALRDTLQTGTKKGNKNKSGTNFQLYAENF
jgi:hypothetical protein